MSPTWAQAAVNGAVSDSAPYEARLLTLNATKATTKLGWRQVWPFPRALRMTVDWYKAHAAGRNVRDLTIQQIAAFQGAN